MRLVVDANILVGELLRVQGKALIAAKRLDLFLAEKAWEEAHHELRKRVNIIIKRGMDADAANELLEVAIELAQETLTLVSQTEYQTYEKEAHLRIPNDPADWHSVALALTLEADIWTQDKDFLGCGVATWTSATLRAKLGLMA